jgi:small-conductance mechanosensitive channel
MQNEDPEALTESIENTIAIDTQQMSLLIRIGIAAGIVIAQAILIRLIWFLFKLSAAKIQAYGEKHIKPLKINSYQLLDTKQILKFVFFLLRIVKYIFTAFQLFLTIPIVFSQFPLTQNLASTLFGYILTPLKDIGLGIIGYIPNLFTIAIIIFIVRYALRTLKYFSHQIERKKMIIPGFYPDWAQPTFNILRILLYAFTVAVVYPYLPGSESQAFQGVSVFVGIIISLGSSTAIGNLVASLVITYMRPFKIGDRIKINDITGFVVEKSPMIVRLRTHKNEYVTFPNMMVLNTKVINYHTSLDKNKDGLIIYADVTMGYTTPWRLVHEILIAAALKTGHVESTPKPFVLQTALDDFYCRYQINAYTKEVDRVPAIYSELYANLQDAFAAAGIDMTAPTYRINLPLDARDPPSQAERYLPPDPPWKNGQGGA